LSSKPRHAQAAQQAEVTALLYQLTQLTAAYLSQLMWESEGSAAVLYSRWTAQHDLSRHHRLLAGQSKDLRSRRH